MRLMHSARSRSSATTLRDIARQIGLRLWRPGSLATSLIPR